MNGSFLFIMKKEFRIKKNLEIENVIKTGKKKYTKNYIGYSINKDEAVHIRYAISVGKKIGDAHVRNKVKRQVRSIIDNMIDVNQTLDIFIVVKSGILLLNYQDMKK